MSYSPRSELLWKIDPLVEAARKLPEWKEFHRLCGRATLCFDHIERAGRGAFGCTAFTTEKRGENWVFVHRADGRGNTVIAALTDAYEKSGIMVPGAPEMLARGLSGFSYEDLI